MSTLTFSSTLTTTRVIVADDHPIVRFGLCLQLEKDAHFRVVAQANSPAELSKALADVPCDLLVTDFSMPAGPGQDGIRMLDTIRGNHPDLQIIVFTMTRNVSNWRSILDLGIHGLIDKTMGIESLPQAIASVRQGIRYVSPLIQEKISAERAAANRPQPHLSERERDVLSLCISGMRPTEIAKQFNLSIKTVSHHKRRAMVKLGLKSDFDVYALAGRSKPSLDASDGG